MWAAVGALIMVSGPGREVRSGANPAAFPHIFLFQYFEVFSSFSQPSLAPSPLPLDPRTVPNFPSNGALPR